MERSGVFDEHLATHYDATRALSPAAMGEVVGLLGPELEGRGACLEIGVGTGRIALPLASAGVEMIGIDLSAPMLARLLEKGEGVPPFGLVRGDVTALPFADGAFGAGLICHVLHLVPGWQTALTELARVIRRPGLILIERDGSGRDRRPGEIRRHFHRQAGVDPYVRLGVRDGAAVDAMLASLGATVRDLPPVRERQPISVGETIDHLELGIHSSNASLAPATRQQAAAATRSWARERFGDLDLEIAEERSITWRAYDLA